MPRAQAPITMQLIRQSHLSTQKTIARKLEGDVAGRQIWSGR